MARLNLRRSRAGTAILALGALLIAVLILIAGSSVPAHWPAWIPILLYNFGTFIIASIAIALIFEFWQLESLLKDLYDQAELTERIRASGMVGFSTSFYDNINWKDFIRNSDQIDIFFSYGSTWRNSNQEHLEVFLARPSSRLTILLPDRYSQDVIRELSRRFSLETDELTRRIGEAEEFFSSLGERNPGRVRIYRTTRTPVFSFFRFNSRVVFGTYKHAMTRGSIITIVGERGGEFYEWISEEWAALTQTLLQSGETKEVYPELGNAHD